MVQNMKEVTKIIIAMAVLILSITVVSAQSTATNFGVNDAAGGQVTYVEVPVNITNSQGDSITGIAFDISFNSSVLNLTKTRVKRGDLTSAWDSPGYNPATGRLAIVYGGGGTEIPVGSSGSVVILNFSVVGAPGTQSAMELSNIQISNENGEVGTATARNGFFNVNGGVTPPVPELSTIVLFSGGLIGLFGLARWRKNS